MSTIIPFPSPHSVKSRSSGAQQSSKNSAASGSSSSASSVVVSSFLYSRSSSAASGSGFGRHSFLLFLTEIYAFKLENNPRWRFKGNQCMVKYLVRFFEKFLLYNWI